MKGEDKRKGEERGVKWKDEERVLYCRLRKNGKLSKREKIVKEKN